ncbi:MAG: hypothetical protein ACYTG1_09240, partial [Planctomycetota bacterium]
DAASADAGGDAAWRARRRAEAHELLALEQVGPPGRAEVLMLDLRDHLRTVIRLAVPVAVMHDPAGELRVLDHAVVGLTYPRLLLERRLPGSALACLLYPAHGAWHPNIARRPGQPLCFGTHVPAAIPLRELVLAAYGLLSMQNVMLDPNDPAGVLCTEAALWWQDRQDRLPLTTRSFLEPDEPAAPTARDPMEEDHDPDAAPG